MFTNIPTPDSGKGRPPGLPEVGYVVHVACGRSSAQEYIGRWLCAIDHTCLSLYSSGLYNDRLEENARPTSGGEAYATIRKANMG